MSWVETQLLYRKIDANRESCITCGAAHWWRELWMGQCGFCEDDAKQATRRAPSRVRTELSDEANDERGAC